MSSPLEIESKFYCKPFLTSLPVRSPSSNDYLKELFCCGVKLEDLHSLMTHHEQYHTTTHSPNHFHILDIKRPSTCPLPVREDNYVDLCSRAFRIPSIDQNIPFVVPMEDICAKKAVFDMADPDIDEDLSADSLEMENEQLIPPSSYSTPSHMGRISGSNKKKSSNKRRAVKPHSSIKKKKGLESDSTDTDVDILTIDDDELVQPLTQLALLPTPPGTDTEEDLQPAPPKRPPPIIKVDPVTGEKKYLCAVPDCQKQYKNANGLKYHHLHAHSDAPDDELGEKEKRPFMCTVVGCMKRYKNLNGLKYHIEHSHTSILPPTVEELENVDSWELMNPLPGLSAFHKDLNRE